MSTRVLVVDDEPALARALAVTLRAHRYEATVAHSGATALDAVASWRPDVVVLDLGLPDLDGMDVLRTVRSWSGVPVVVLSARQTSDDKVEALDAGADDYVTKPFGMDELLARIRAAVRRRPQDETPPVVATSAFTVDLGRHVVTTADGTEVRLTPTEWHMLEVLARHAGKVVGRRELLTELRGPHLDGESHYLRVYMAQLRRKLEPDPAHPRHLLTEPGLGYRLQP
ncbi:MULTISPECIES: response regulator [Cellulomonas]|uniref:Transcriptional regulatory protein KdpE n=1 Tax=Cellulomonas oligotrophica TaxID=931536 RepID=A0A7Y9JZS0_9CELL|nr:MULTISPECIES: response regulator transcription factor [Cellulomonas]NYD86510.1 two-component system KDP operon response regulator KdpE [Cellulomonas oligotrophica]TQL02361.1 two-component system KDP operon response regulator KdpE [Cellulomonas sp. SLBN-39]GIG32600.1 putative transcriptional regulatory protein KdpE [Cellulomonas oligotrophica]